MSGFLDILGAVMMLGGALFLALGGLGLIRIPDIYNRIQAGTKATTLGTLLVLARAAHRSGAPMTPGTKADRLGEDAEDLA